MAKTDNTTATTNRKLDSVALNVTGKSCVGGCTIAVDIAQTNSNFVRSSVQSDLDTAESVAEALAISTKLPTRVTIDGGVYKIFHRAGG